MLVEKLVKKSIYEKQIVDVVTQDGESWMTPIKEYLMSEILQKIQSWQEK